VLKDDDMLGKKKLKPTKAGFLEKLKSHFFTLGG
jgi:hypothetical protein